MPSRNMKDALPIVEFACASDWEDWVLTQPGDSKGAWLKVAKKDSGILSVSRQEAIDGALCHGWIDGQLQKWDDLHWLIRFTPRSARSKWSRINTTRAEELIANGRMSAAGLEQIARAKADGRWESAYEPQSKVAVPDDLQTALDKSPAAKRLFNELNGLNRYAMLYRIHNTKGPETRALKIKKYVEMLKCGETIYPLKAKK